MTPTQEDHEAASEIARKCQHPTDAGTVPCLSCIAAALSEAVRVARQEEREAQWRPIESAPEAETVLVWLPSYGAVTANRTTDHGIQYWWSRAGHGEHVYPTHWQPITTPRARTDAQATPAPLHHEHCDTMLVGPDGGKSAKPCNCPQATPAPEEKA